MTGGSRYAVKRLLAMLEEDKTIELVLETSQGEITLVFGSEQQCPDRALLSAALSGSRLSPKAMPGR
jgi:hypothetical protein